MKKIIDADISIRLEASEEKYRTFFENSMDAILITSQDGRIFSANKAACTMLGWDEKEIILLGRDGIVEKTSELDVAMELRKVSGLYFGEVIFIKKDGTHFPAEISSSSFTSEGNELTAIIARDITERKKTEKALHSSEERLRLAGKATGFGTYSYDFKTRSVYYSDEFYSLYGISREEKLSEDTLFQATYPEDIAHSIVAMRQANDPEGDGILDYEYRIVRSDKEMRWLKVRGLTTFTGNSKNDLPLKSNGIIQDITDRKVTEVALRDVSLYSRSLIEASLDPLITINSEGKITDVNMSTEGITGVSRTKLIGSDFAAYFADRKHAIKGYKMVFSKGFVKNYPLSILNIDGRQIDVLFNASLFRNVTGEIQGVLAAARDITELKRMEEELLNSKKLLEKMNQHLLEVRENERSEIALNLHDDLGQRLTAINLDVAWLKGRVGVQTPAVLKKFKEINSSINETIDGIKEISAFLRPAILYDLGIVNAFEWQLRRTEKMSGIKCDFSYSLTDIKIDDRMSLILYRVLQESLTNVVRHSLASMVTVDLKEGKDKVILRIEDNGIGIEKSKINSLTSMGITGIKERVASVNGKAIIKAKKNKGTTILVQIPVKYKPEI